MEHPSGVIPRLGECSIESGSFPFWERSASGGGELALKQRDEVADGVHGFELGGLELDFETGFDGDDEVDVVEGIPLGDACGGEGGGEDEGVVVEDVVEDGGEPGSRFRAVA